MRAPADDDGENVALHARGDTDRYLLALNFTLHEK
jgi:hypothetical protein